MNPIMLMNQLSNVKGMINTIKTAQDPMAALAQNPKMKEAMSLVQGKNPEEVFYQKCKEMGVDPNVILGMLR